jgi:uncharacterized protein YbjT (DUF2867 family)
MAQTKTITIFGGTGAQGGGLARAILADPQSEFRARVATRNPDSEKARALATAGAEVVHADLDRPETLKPALQGAYGAFCVTNYWEHFSPERELEQAKAMAQAARDAGVRHVIWSTLEDTRERVPLEDDRMPTLQGRYKVPHFDAKGEANALFTSLGVPVTLLHTSFYWDNFIYFGLGPKPNGDGTLAITLPLADAKLPGIASEDIGKCAYGIFKRGDEFIGKTVGIAGEHLTGTEMARLFTEALGTTVRYNDVPADVYRGFGFPGADDLGNMFQYKRDFEPQYCAARPVEFARELNPELQTFAEWLERHKGQIPTS